MLYTVVCRETNEHMPHHLSKWVAVALAVKLHMAKPERHYYITPILDI